MYICTRTEEKNQLMPVLLVDSVCSSDTVEHCLDESDYYFSSKKLKIKLITIKNILLRNPLKKLKKTLTCTGRGRESISIYSFTVLEKDNCSSPGKIPPLNYEGQSAFPAFYKETAQSDDSVTVVQGQLLS